jgi:hypothetical protein
MDVTLRALTDVDAVVAFSLDAWAPVFADFEQVMGPRAYRFVYPDWRTARAAAVARRAGRSTPGSPTSTAPRRASGRASRAGCWSGQ